MRAAQTHRVRGKKKVAQVFIKGVVIDCLDQESFKTGLLQLANRLKPNPEPADVREEAENRGPEAIPSTDSGTDCNEPVLCDGWSDGFWDWDFDGDGLDNI